MLHTISTDFLDTFIDAALAEDAPQGDITSMACIAENSRSKGKLLAKEPGIIAGVDIARRIFYKLDPLSTFTQFIGDGQPIHVGDIIFELQCNTRALLLGERLALNVMQRMSGIATLSNRFKFEVEDLPVTILDTRKTTPLLRPLEKWAVALGGCNNYRFGLSDWFMVKDNHISACGGIAAALEKVQAYKKKQQLDLGVTLEVKNLVELYEAMEIGGFNRVMLDNFEIPLLQEAVSIVGKRVETEASGGVNIYSVRKIALTGVDFISVGSLTHSAGSLDLSLKIIS